jgi:asparagine synthetase B (glutamine-hydrolysing)
VASRDKEALLTLEKWDTEAILEAYREYGESCVQHFNGQWAFGIWDETRHKLFLSRDRLGVTLRLASSERRRF